jgi:branched-subunit amino acid aminotransferase/4-amino-4-deoxychorismate lyase
MGDTVILRWAEGRFVVDEWCDTNIGEVRVADSFVLLDGAIVGFERHFARFVRGVHAVDPGFDSGAFLAGLREALPRTGEWFPRIEALAYGTGLLYRLLIRPMPIRQSAVTVATAPHDPRRFPTVKGPDLQRLGAMRRELGEPVGEAIIVTDGVIAEGAWSSVVWWEDDTLHRVAPEIARLDGVTESIVAECARQLGTPIVDGRRRPDELDGCEVWVLSALHGIRTVAEWIDGPLTMTQPGRVELWRGLYETRRVMLTP